MNQFNSLVIIIMKDLDKFILSTLKDNESNVRF